MRFRLGLLKCHFRPYPWFFAGTLVSSIGCLVFEVTTTAVVYPMKDSSVSSLPGEDNVISRWFASLLDGVVPARRGVALVLVFAVSYIILTVLNFCRSVLPEVFSRVVTRDFRAKILEKYVRSDYQYLVSQRQGTPLFRALAAPAFRSATRHPA
jgi:hypothetical protein